MSTPPDTTITRGRAAWNYVWVSTFHVALFAGSGFMYALVYRPLQESAWWIIPTFAVAGLVWGVWLANRVNRGKEDLS